jgi:peptide deformylase
MTQSRTVIQLGHPTLRQAAVAVDDFQAPELQTLIEGLMLTVRAAQGVGIAAPQVADSRRLVIVASRPNERYPQAPTMAPTPMINPRLVAHGAERVKGWEGCLSVPGIRGLVPRYREIEVAYQDRWGGAISRC